MSEEARGRWAGGAQKSAAMGLAGTDGAMAVQDFVFMHVRMVLRCCRACLPLGRLPQGCTCHCAGTPSHQILTYGQVVGGTAQINKVPSRPIRAAHLLSGWYIWSAYTHSMPACIMEPSGRRQ
jgi:hypothetical protein